MPQNIATTDRIDELVDAWIKDGRFANRSEAFRAGIFALKEKLQGSKLGQISKNKRKFNPSPGQSFPFAVLHHPLLHTFNEEVNIVGETMESALDAVHRHSH